MKATCDFVSKGLDPVEATGLTNLGSITEPISEAVAMETRTTGVRDSSKGAAVIVAQHEPGEPGLEQVVWRLLGPRLRGAVAAETDPLLALRAGMERLAVRDADRRLAELLVALA